MPMNSYTDFVRRLKKVGAVGTLYLLTGEEAFLVGEGVRLLREAALVPGMSDFNLDVFHEGVNDAARVIDVALTYPVMAPIRMVIVYRIEAWPKKEWEMLHAYCLKASPTTCLVMTAGKLDAKKNAIVDAIAKLGVVVTCTPLKNKELGEWIGSQIRLAGKSIDPDAVAYWASMLGSDLSRLRREIEKVVTYVGPRTEILLEDVSLLATGGRSISAFEFVQALGERDVRAALPLLNKSLESAVPIEILGVILWNFRRLAVALEQVRKGTSYPDAALKARIPAFAIKGVVKQMEKFRLSEIPQLFELFLEADLDIKGGSSLPPERVLERLVMEVCAR